VGEEVHQELEDYSQVDILGLQYKSVNFEQMARVGGRLQPGVVLTFVVC